MKKSNIFWGSIFVLSAVLILLSTAGILGDFGTFSICCGVILGAILIKSIVSLSIGGVCFSLAFLVILFDGVLGLTKLTPWPVLMIATLLTIGLNLIFGDSLRKIRKRNGANAYTAEGHYDQIIDDVDQDSINFSIKFGSVAKYINCDNFTRGDFSSAFGELSVYFDNAVIQGASASVNVDVSFGDLKLYIPKTWRVENNVHSSFAGVDEHGRTQWQETPKVLYLNGNVAFGAVEIYYI